MPRPKAPHGRTGRPPVTSREQILAAARRIIERDGFEKLTIRRLAAELGIGPTTLYHHVRDREDLLIQMLNEQADQSMRADLPDDPRERIVTAAVAIHDGLASWPWAAEILTTDGFLGRLGEPAIRPVEAVLDGAIAYGCTSEQAVDLFRNLWYFTVGEILVRTHSKQRRPGIEPPAVSDTFFSANVDMTWLPRLAEIGDEWPMIAARDTFAPALRAFVDGLLAQATTGRSATS